MSKNWTYSSGDWWAICDSCGQKHKASNMRKRWDGFFVCADDWEERHSQDFVKARQDKITVPWTRPRPNEEYIPTNWTPPLNEELIVHDDNITYIAEWYRDVDEVCTITETVEPVVEYIRTIGETVTLSDNFVYLQVTELSVNDTVNVTEDIGGIGYPVYDDSVSITENITSLLYNAQTATDTVTITETIVADLTYNTTINGSPINRGVI